MDDVRLGWPWSARWPLRVGVVPPLAGCFQQRVSGVVDDARSGMDWGTPTQIRVLAGIGGVGKTQVAAYYVEREWARRAVDLLVWVTATSKDAIVAGYAETAFRVFGVEEGGPLHAAERLLAWLAGTDKAWLVALDDVQDPADVRGLLPPAVGSGQVVITTRRRDAALARLGRSMFEVNVFTPEESVSYLHAALADTPHLTDGAVELAEDLGHLPLALAQVAAYLIDRDLSCTDYRARLADRLRKLADVLPTRSELPDDHRDTVAATWSLSVDLADQLAPAGLARPLLTVASLVNPNGCPIEVFTSASLLTYLQTITGRRVGVDDVRDMLRGLHRLSLINVERRLGVRIHALVQRAIRETLSYSDLDQIADVTAQSLLEIWPEVESDLSMAQVLRSNAESLHARAETSLWDGTGYRVLFRAAKSLGDLGLASAAAAAYEKLVTSAGQHNRHTDSRVVLAARREYARWQGEAGDPRATVTAFIPLLEDYRQAVGPDDPGTLNLRGHLGYWRRKAGDVTGAVADYEELLLDNTRVLGADHPDTLSVRANLAQWRGEDGDPAGATAATDALIADITRALGRDDIQTLWNRSNRAHWQGELGDAAGAVDALRKLLVDHRRVLGPSHPHTLRVRRSVAEWLGVAGCSREAAEELESLMDDVVRAFGPHHPDTIQTSDRLAYWRDRTDADS